MHFNRFCSLHLLLIRSQWKTLFYLIFLISNHLSSCECETWSHIGFHHITTSHTNCCDSYVLYMFAYCMHFTNIHNCCLFWLDARIGTHSLDRRNACSQTNGAILLPGVGYEPFSLCISRWIKLETWKCLFDKNKNKHETGWQNST